MKVKSIMIVVLCGLILGACSDNNSGTDLSLAVSQEKDVFQELTIEMGGAYASTGVPTFDLAAEGITTVTIDAEQNITIHQQVINRDDDQETREEICTTTLPLAPEDFDAVLEGIVTSDLIDFTLDESMICTMEYAGWYDISYATTDVANNIRTSNDCGLSDAVLDLIDTVDELVATYAMECEETETVDVEPADADEDEDEDEEDLTDEESEADAESNAQTYPVYFD